MTGRATVWNIMAEHLPRRQWINIKEIFAVVESRSILDEEDLGANPVGIPRWRVTVRRALREKQESGHIRGRRSLQ